MLQITSQGRTARTCKHSVQFLNSIRLWQGRRLPLLASDAQLLGQLPLQRPLRREGLLAGALHACTPLSRVSRQVHNLSGDMHAFWPHEGDSAWQLHAHMLPHASRNKILSTCCTPEALCGQAARQIWSSSVQEALELSALLVSLLPTLACSPVPARERRQWC